jgi:hypothetical protein
LWVALALLGLVAGCAWASPITLPVPASTRPVLTTVGDPANNVVTRPSFFDGVGRLIINNMYGCSGSLLSSGRDVLTAAHCLDTDLDGNPDVTSLTATFYTPSGPRTFSGASYSVSPLWTGEDLGDVGVVRLATGTGIPGYDIFRPGDDYGDGIATLAGYGLSGTGVTGEVLPFGTLRRGTNNFYEVLWETGGLPFAFAYDFDDGTPVWDTWGRIFGVWEYGLPTEVMLGAGDSGGPSFIGLKIAGIHSFGATFGPPYDADNLVNGTFGELGGDTIVELYSGWIDQTAAIPEPGTLLLMGAGLLGIAWLRRRGR